MTNRARVVLVFFILSLIAAFATGRDIYFSLTYVWGGLLLISFLISRVALNGLEIERTPRSLRAQVGRTYEETIILRNNSRFPKLWVEVRDFSELPGHRATSVALRLRSGKERNWLIRTLCTRRGRFRMGPIQLHGGDPFGLFPMVLNIPREHHIVVMPKTEQIRNFPFPSGRLPGGDALRQRTHQVTPNASGVRDYVPGDSLNRIHWRSTARLRRLIVKEFEFDPQAEVWIVLDGEGAVHFGEVQERRPELVSGVIHGDFALPRSTEEYAVAIAASLSLHLLERDRAAGFVAHGRARHVLQSDRGQAQLYHILESLAVLEADGNFSLEEVLKVEGPRIPRGASVVVISPSTRAGIVEVTRELKRLGLAPVIVLINASTFGGPDGSQELLLAAQAEGIPVRMINYEDSLAESLSRRVFLRTWESAA
ncbi:MAG: DUF58 domain-containing protein [Anaerolineales bacterium]|nr:DUF58 domain-containing protein [Anaerolineales bacterium]